MASQTCQKSQRAVTLEFELEKLTFEAVLLKAGVVHNLLTLLTIFFGCDIIMSCKSCRSALSEYDRMAKSKAFNRARYAEPEHIASKHTVDMRRRASTSDLHCFRRCPT